MAPFNPAGNAAENAAPSSVTAKPVIITHQPEWIRLPKSGQACLHSGLSRSHLNALILPCSGNEFRPPVESISVRKAGAKRGVRLINLKSLLDHLNSLKGGAQ